VSVEIDISARRKSKRNKYKIYLFEGKISTSYKIFAGGSIPFMNSMYGP
jgi:hypothetical protein